MKPLGKAAQSHPHEPAPSARRGLAVSASAAPDRFFARRTQGSCISCADDRRQHISPCQKTIQVLCGIPNTTFNSGRGPVGDAKSTGAFGQPTQYRLQLPAGSELSAQGPLLGAATALWLKRMLRGWTMWWNWYDLWYHSLTSESGILFTVVTVTHNSHAALPELMASIPGDVPVIVVDNASADVSEVKRIAASHGARLICNKENIGYGRANNQGAAEAQTELVFFVNPDVILLDSTLGCLADASRSYRQASAFGPAIQLEDGKQSFRRYSLLAPGRESLSSPKRGWPKFDQEVPVLSGSALVVRKRDFDSVGGFDPEIFLYHEDDDLCLRLKANCGPLMWIRKARVTHAQGQGSGTALSTYRLKGYHMGYSRVYASVKHGVPMAFERAVFSAIGELLLLPRLVSARRRAKSLAYLSGIMSARHLAPSAASRIKWWLN